MGCGRSRRSARRQLEELGRDLAQGFHVSRPLPADAMTRLPAERCATLEHSPRVADEPFPFRGVHGYVAS